MLTSSAFNIMSGTIMRPLHPATNGLGDTKGECLEQCNAGHGIKELNAGFSITCLTDHGLESQHKGHDGEVTVSRLRLGHNSDQGGPYFSITARCHSFAPWFSTSNKHDESLRIVMYLSIDHSRKASDAGRSRSHSSSCHSFCHSSIELKISAPISKKQADGDAGQ